MPSVKTLKKLKPSGISRIGERNLVGSAMDYCSGRLLKAHYAIQCLHDFMFFGRNGDALRRLHDCIAIEVP